VAVLDYRPGEASVRATMLGDGWVVFLESFDAGWRATVDGEPAPVFRADAVFQAVHVPAGVHVVGFRYRPRSWPLAVALSVLGLAVIACMVAAGRPRMKKRR
jgi:uncharacterized membrane protein YfhO